MLVVFGGTFDPVHIGHIHAAECASQELGQPVELMLASQPRLRDAPSATECDRWQMLQLACREHHNLRASQFEATLSKPTRTTSTIHALKQQTDQQVVYIIGSDILANLHEWYQAEKLPKLLSFYVLQRPGTDCTPPSKSFNSTNSITDLAHQDGQIYVSKQTMLDISASQVRNTIRQQGSFQHLVPSIVYDYIISNDVYRKRKTD